MPRRTQSNNNGRQLALALDPRANSANGPALFAAYRRLDLSRRLSFEQVMSDRAYAIGVRNLADAIARRGTCRNPKTRACGETAQDSNTPSSSRTDVNH